MDCGPYKVFAHSKRHYRFAATQPRVGAGWLDSEFRALGVPMQRRGELMDDSLRAMRALWTMEKPAHRGSSASFSNVVAYPRPAQSPMPPIVIGGESPAALVRAIMMGN